MAQIPGSQKGPRRAKSSEGKSDAEGSRSLSSAIGSEEALVGILATFDADGALWIEASEKLPLEAWRGEATRRLVAEIYNLESERQGIDSSSWVLAAERACLTDRETADLLDTATTARGFRRFIREIENAHQRNRLYRLGMNLADQASGATDIEGALDSAMAATVEASSHSTEEDHTMLDLYDKLLAELADVSEGRAASGGITTGFPILDDCVRLRPGCVYTIAGRTTTGKSALLLNMLANIAQEHPVFAYILEMSPVQLAERQASRLIGQPWRDFEHDLSMIPDFREALIAATINTPGARQAAWNIKITKSRGTSVNNFARKVRLRHAKDKIQVAAIDYLQLLRAPPGAGNGWDIRETMVHAMATIVDLAGELQIPIVILSQLGRKAEERKGPPRLSDLAESGAVENDSDFVALLDRRVGSENLDLHIAKNRLGRAGHYYECEFLARKMEFRFLREAIS